ncbi:radical SAM/SPASM domain-containing protein [Candidatus Magnetominusculus dajiuhuensis]|uniref:radical SAM/SPASM domain-containing protein n=1 Tax=Candidatus Magnetominusculus dajiuhuensis TaxID=3137712 RepID=UPI003B429CE8
MGRGPTPEYYKVLNNDYVKGTLTCLKPSTIKRVVNANFPNVINIEPTNRCNLKCVYCPRESADKGVGIMDWDLYVRLIDEASEYDKLLMLNFHKDGESFLHPRFMDMIGYAKKKNVAKVIHMNTNALCWTDNVIEELLHSGIDDITVSLDAAWPDTYKKQKGVDCLEKVEKQVWRFFQRRTELKRKSPFVRVKIMEFSDVSHEEIEAFHKKWLNVADMVQVTGIHSWSGAIKNISVTDETAPVRYPCVIMWYSLVINWNGEATVCSVDWNTEIKVGDVRRQTIHQIWKSQAIKEARQSQINNDYDKYKVCKDCVVWVSIGDITDWLIKKKELYL